MRLKTFTAPSTSLAMRQVRREMGDEAIIVSTRRSKGVIRVTAALDTPRSEDVLADAVVRRALSYHGTPAPLAERLQRATATLQADDPVMGFAAALDANFAFQPLPVGAGERPIMLVGPPGAGKTVATAKLAARATLSGHAPAVISTDTRRAGGLDQLAAFTRILEIDLKDADSAEALAAAVAAGGSGLPIYVDTAGTNPFSDAEMSQLGGLAAAAAAEVVLVLAAGGDALEMADIAASFAAIGATRLLVTRLDMARRIGGVLAAGAGGGLKFCNVSITPDVADGLSPINPVSLARLIMPRVGAGEEIRYEAAS